MVQIMIFIQLSGKSSKFKIHDGILLFYNNKSFYSNNSWMCFKLNDLTLHNALKIGTNLLNTYGLKFLLSNNCSNTPL